MGTTLWYASRGFGCVLLVLLTASLLLGLTTSGNGRFPWPAFVTVHLHRTLALLALAFCGIHVVTALVDPYANLGLKDALVPFASAYRPFWLGLGVVAAELLLAVVLTSLVRERLGFRWWKGVHWLAYAAWPLALLHGVGTGDDLAAAWFILLNLGSLALVLVAVCWRLGRAWPQPERRLAAALTAGLVFLAFSFFDLGGPAQPGWAQVAGTPAASLTRGAP